MTDTPAEREGESTWARLRRRKVVQWGVAYAAGAWLLMQVLEYFSGTYDWPRRVQQLSTLALLIGLPIVLVLAWYHGDRGQQRSSTIELAILTLLLLLGGGALWYYQRANETPIAASTAAQPAAAAATPPDVLAAPDEKSIAVLPFADMSAEKDQEYMSDGMAEELLNLLARVPDLKVIARTSSFAFKGEKIEIDEIAEKLNVAHILEGSVRTSGNKLRITAQLIRTADSTHLWSETYDRTLDDTFAVQDDIAAKVVEALKATLLGGEISTSAEPQDVEAYTYFLQGRHFAQRQSQEDCERALRYLQQSIDRNAAHAPAWVERANVQLTQADNGWIPFTSAEGYAVARDSVEKALTLDPKLASAHSAMAYIQAGLWDWAAADQSSRTAVALEPGNADALLRAGVITADLGRPEEAAILIRKSIERDPLRLDAHEWLGYVLFAIGRYAEAEIAYRKFLELDPNRTDGHVSVGKSLLLQGKPEEALREVEQERDEARRLPGLSLVYHTLGRKADADAALALMKEKYADDRAFRIAEAHAWRGENDLAFDWLDRAYAVREVFLADIQLSPYLQRLADDPRFKAFLRKMKLPERPAQAIAAAGK